MAIGKCVAASLPGVTNSNIDAPHNGICDTCGKTCPITNFASKGFHTTKNGTKIRYRSKRCRKCEKAQKVKSGICKMCFSPAEHGKNHCQKHLDLLKSNKKKQKIHDRQQAFQHYNNKCAYCGENNEMFLTIDHIENNGAEHRRQQRNGQNKGHDIYAWLRKNNYPEGFQVLCYNCNCAKGIYGEQAVKDAAKENQ